MKRRFRGLREREPSASYDAVIIGAGVGGLVCGCLLAREGLSVLLVEQHYMVGGYCSTFKRGGFTFDAATHFYPLLGNPATLTGGLLAELGVETGWVKMDPVDTFHFPDGSRFAVPADFDAYLARVKTEFPAEAEAIDRFFAQANTAYLHGLVHYFKGRRTAWLDEHAHLTVRDALDSHFEDRRLKLLLTADCPHWGSPPERTSFVFDSMLRLSYFLGNYYPVGGSQAFADELARRFEELGGSILMSTRALRIQVEDGEARGVELETVRGPRVGRRTVRAGHVVSNADLRLTLEELLPRPSVDPDLLDSVRSMRPSFPCFLTHVGLRGVSDRLLDEAQGYYWNDWNPDRVGAGGLRCKIFSPTLYDPGVAPPDCQIVILQKVLDMEALPVPISSASEWWAHKAEIESYVLAHLASVVPEIEEKIVVSLSATANTAERFTLNLDGAMLGWEMSPEQLGAGRPSIRGPVSNLFLTGHWVRPGGGITPVIVSAMQVAEAITGVEPRAPRLEASLPGHTVENQLEPG